MTKDSSRELALAAADLAADGKATGITILDLREVSSVADWFVIASGRSHIQVDAVCDRIEKGIAERFGARPISVEGLENAQWALIDYGSVVVHVFQEQVRELYDLERLWSLAPRWKFDESGLTPLVARSSREPRSAHAARHAQDARSDETKRSAGL